MVRILRPLYLTIILFFSIILLLNAQQSAEYIYTSPPNGAKLVSVYNNIIIRSSESLDVDPTTLANSITIEGETSGTHEVIAMIAKDSKTMVFNLISPFVPSEHVQVNLQEGIQTVDGSLLPSLNFGFVTSKKGISNYPNYAQAKSKLNINQITSFDYASKELNSDTLKMFGTDSLPIDYPVYRFNYLNTEQPGYIFLTPFYMDNFTATHSFITVCDNYGTPIYYLRNPGFGVDAKVQPNGWLTYFNGPFNAFIALNNKYEPVDTIRCQNGYFTDLHELRILENGDRLLMSYDQQPISMDTVVEGGNPNALVEGLVIQELDENDNVVFQWRSWDHFKITDCTEINLQDSLIDYVHGNAIEVDVDGNLLISSRHLDEITKINRKTGDIIWRMGGTQNQMNFLNDNRRYSRQHHIRVLDNGHYTLFDNGNYLIPQYSSALEYSVDEDNKTAELVWSYADEVIYGAFMGSVERLDNGHTFIGWGGTHPSYTEINSDKEKILEVDLSEPYLSYRAFRQDWSQSVFSISKDTLNFKSNSTRTDTLYFDLTNNIGHDLIITSAVTRTDNFKVINQLPFTLVSKGTTQIEVVAKPATDENIGDVLTIRSDSEDLGYGVQIVLNSNIINSITDDPLTNDFTLLQNYPNPFNPSTKIEFNIPKSGMVNLTIYDVLGREVATLVNKQMVSGYHSFEFDGSNLSSGVYFYKLKSGSFLDIKKMMLLK